MGRLFAIAVIVLVGCPLDSATLTRVSGEESRLEVAARAYGAHHPSCSPTAGGLIADIAVDPDFAWFDRSTLAANDPWGTPYAIQCGNFLEVRSAGPDKRYKTGDDITIAVDTSGGTH